MKYETHSINLLLLFAAVILNSCESDFNVKVPDSGPSIVVNSIIDTEDSVRIYLTKSISLRNKNDTSSFVRNAKVVLYSQGYHDTLKLFEHHSFSLDECYYTSTSIPTAKPGQIFDLKVLVPGMKEISSSTQILQPVQIVSIDTLTTSILNGGHFVKTLEIKIRFIDPPEIGNYYKIDVTRVGLVTIFGDGYGNQKVILGKYVASSNTPDKNAIYFIRPKDSPQILNPEIPEDELWYDEIFLSDKNFNGKEYVLKLNVNQDFFYDFANQPTSEEAYTERRINIRLSSIHPDYFRYSESYFNQINKRQDIFSEPVSVYTNILNGLGIFSTSSASVDSSVIVKVRYGYIVTKSIK